MRLGVGKTRGQQIKSVVLSCRDCIQEGKQLHLNVMVPSRDSEWEPSWPHFLCKKRLPLMSSQGTLETLRNFATTFVRGCPPHTVKTPYYKYAHTLFNSVLFFPGVLLMEIKYPWSCFLVSGLFARVSCCCFLYLKICPIRVGLICGGQHLLQRLVGMVLHLLSLLVTGWRREINADNGI